MNTAIPDLWPDDIVAAAEPSPATVLRQQGYLLGQKTRNFVVGEVKSSGSATEFNHEFWISAPLLNVRVRLLWVQHGLQFYPAKVRVFQIKDHTAQRGSYDAADLGQFTAIIKSILADDDVRELIRSLTSQCLDLEES